MNENVEVSEFSFANGIGIDTGKIMTTIIKYTYQRPKVVSIETWVALQ
jgi:hypothetical protein